MFDPVSPKQSFPDLEKGILEYWKVEDIFKRSMQGIQEESVAKCRVPKVGPDAGATPLREERARERGTAGSSFTFYDGPPFATGLPHYGHLLAGTIKDVIPRYKTMRGYRVERRWGWDCHGLPVEVEIEKEHRFKGKRDIEERVGVKGFNDLCRGIVQRYTDEWRRTVERTGRFVDMDHDYRTMDPDYMESVWRVFKTLYEKGLVYEDYKSMHICPRCVTPLSNFEVTLGYKDVVDHGITAKFKLPAPSSQLPADAYLLAWTTTGWTLPGNLFLALGPKIPYAKVLSDGDVYIVAKPLVEQVFEGREYEIAGAVQAKDLEGKRYEPLFPYFTKKYGDGAYRLVLGDFVTMDEGTGIVHIATGFGQDDYEVGKKESVDVLHHVTMEGCFTDEVTDFKDMEVKPMGDPTKTDKMVAKWLKRAGKLFAEGPYKHSYPHCWRCEAPLLNYACKAWFVAVEKIKKDLLKANRETRWVPDSVRTGRFGEWLANAKDWCISRQRYWGCPIPIWRAEDAPLRDASPHVKMPTEAKPQEASGRRGLASPLIWGEAPQGDRSNDIIVIGSRDELMSRCLQRFTKITVVRHAESEGNRETIYQGREPGTDLTERGIVQAQELAERLARSDIPPSTFHIPITTIYSSPLARTQQTAEILNETLQCALKTDERLRELHFGPYEGKHVDFDHARYREQREGKILKRKVESIYHFEGMETWESVEKRLRSFLAEVLPTHRGQHIMIITHADPCMNFEHIFTGLDKYQVSHRPYPKLAQPRTYYYDHETGRQMDLHKETVDGIMWSALRDGPPCHTEGPGAKRKASRSAAGGPPQGDMYKRIPEVLDCWFESGSMPYGQQNYPFAGNSKSQIPNPKRETKNEPTNKRMNVAAPPPGFPADFIAEGLDQTRGWFYTLMVLSVALYKQPAFKNCVVNGIVLAEDGKKMSKRLKNYPEPTEIMDKYGADAMRFALMSSPAVRAEEIRFSEKLVEEQLKQVLLPLWNTYHFFVTYANAAHWENPKSEIRNLKSPLDRWILAHMQDLVNKMTEELDRYDLSATCAHLRDSIDGLTNWYIRRSRRRFAGKTSKEDQEQALATLHRVLLTISKLLAPFCPFLTEEIYLNLTDDDHGSIHLSPWPEPRKLTKKEMEELERTEMLRRIVPLGLRVRSEAKVKVRQPLAQAFVALPPSSKVSLTKVDLNTLAEELNVKNVELVPDPLELAETVVEVNPRLLGPRLGKKVQSLIEAAKRGHFTENDDGTVTVLGEVLSPEEVTISYREKEGTRVAVDHGLVVSLDTTMTMDLEREGQARDLIRAIQKMRKDAGMSLTETATIQVEGAATLFKEYGKMILEETKSELGRGKKAVARIELELPDTYVTVSLLKNR